MFIQRKIIKAVLLSFLLVITSCQTGQQKNSNSFNLHKNKNRGRATGYATILDNDTALARDRAIDDAKNKLVRKILGETIQGKSIMKNYELVSTIVEARSSGLVKDATIIKRWKEGNEVFVTIEGTVYPSMVEDAINSILKTYGRPKFMVLINENLEGRVKRPGFTETEMIIQEVMGNSGFEFVDANMVRQLMKRERNKMNMAINGNVNKNVQQLLLNDVGAEVLIVGSTEVEDQSQAIRAYSKTMLSKSATIKLKAIDVYTGNILASISRTGKGINIAQIAAFKKAIEKALKKILGKKNRYTGKFKTGPFVNSIVRKFVQASTNREIHVTITGLNGPALTKFRNQVKQRIRGVQKVKPNGRVGNAAKITIYFAGKTYDLEQELTSKAGKLGFTIVVKESFPNKLVLSVTKN